MILPRRRPALPRRPRRDVRALRVRLESLESRTVLSTTDVVPSISAYLATLAAAGSGSAAIGPAVGNAAPSASAVSPSSLISAYGFSGSATSGQGTTVAIVGAYDNPTIQADLAAFSSYYGLAAASLTVVNQYGQATNLPRADAGWSLETAMDVEWVHAVARGARIILVEASSSSASDLMTAVQTASKLANVVSMSWGGSEWSGQTAYDTSSYFANPNVTFVAASGDDGGASGASWPASSPYVLGVGGTTLSTGAASETAWSASGSPWAGYSGSGGGVSRVESLPAYQASALGSRAASGRVTPDVASVANPNTGVAVYSTAGGQGQSGWFSIGGTSAGAPVWAGLVADADQARAAAGKSPLGSSQTLSLLYSLYGTSTSRSASYAAAFRDVTSGGNFAGGATAGYDAVTGLGSPHASTIIAAAAGFTATTTAVATTTTIPVRVIRPRARVRAHTADDSTAAATTDATATTTTVTTTAAPIAVGTAVTTTATATVAATPTSTTTVATAASSTVATSATPAALPNQPIVPPATMTRLSLDPAEEPQPTPTPAAAKPRAEAPDARGSAEVGEMSTPEAEPEPAAPGTTPAPTPAHEEAPPAADPADLEVWDEALAEVAASRPTPTDRLGRPSEHEDDETSPRLAVALGLIAVAWGGRRIRSRADARRFVVPTPSLN